MTQRDLIYGARIGAGLAFTQLDARRAWGVYLMFMPIPRDKQRPLVDRLMKATGGAYTPKQRRKYFISGPQWAGAYEGHALFHAATRTPVPSTLSRGELARGEA